MDSGGAAPTWAGTGQATKVVTVSAAYPGLVIAGVVVVTLAA
jgi:hypothetical protein